MILGEMGIRFIPPMKHHTEYIQMRLPRHHLHTLPQNLYPTIIIKAVMMGLTLMIPSHNQMMFNNTIPYHYCPNEYNITLLDVLHGSIHNQRTFKH